MYAKLNNYCSITTRGKCDFIAVVFVWILFSNFLFHPDYIFGIHLKFVEDKN